MEISRTQFEKVIQDAIRIGMTAALVKAGRLRPYLKKKEAFQNYGRKHVEHWLDEGLVTPRKDGGHSAAWRLDRVELEIVATAITMCQYLPD